MHWDVRIVTWHAVGVFHKVNLAKKNRLHTLPHPVIPMRPSLLSSYKCLSHLCDPQQDWCAYITLRKKNRPRHRPATISTYSISIKLFSAKTCTGAKCQISDLFDKCTETRDLKLTNRCTLMYTVPELLNFECINSHKLAVKFPWIIAKIFHSFYLKRHLNSLLCFHLFYV